MICELCEKPASQIATIDIGHSVTIINICDTCKATLVARMEVVWTKKIELSTVTNEFVSQSTN